MLTAKSRRRKCHTERAPLSVYSPPRFLTRALQGPLRIDPLRLPHKNNVQNAMQQMTAHDGSDVFPGNPGHPGGPSRRAINHSAASALFQPNLSPASPPHSTHSTVGQEQRVPETIAIQKRSAVILRGIHRATTPRASMPHQCIQSLRHCCFLTCWHSLTLHSLHSHSFTNHLLLAFLLLACHRH